jgi:cytochrome P450
VGIESRINGESPPQVRLSDIDLGSWDFWRQDDQFRNGAFATLRHEAPISFFPQFTRDGEEPGKGHWALTKYDDVQHASRHPEIFSSVPSTTMADFAPEVAEYAGSMLMLDDPRHHRLRSIVSRAFTPKVLAATEESVRERARRLVTAMVANNPDGAAELVSELAAPFPLQVICDLMGIPEQDYDQVFYWTNVILSFGDPAVTSDFGEYAKAADDMGTYAHTLAEERRRNPRNDLTSSLVAAEVDGEQLTSAEIASFFILLAIAGNETTRHAITRGVLALTHYPDQRQRWWSDFDGLSRTAVEEIVRWASPVNYMRRTLTEDTELSGVQMSAGDKVTLWYPSANRDESKFVDPWRFDVGRDPNPHVGYGAGGVHFCLGANLARREITAIFNELHRQTPDVVADAQPVLLLSPTVNGIRELSVSWSPQH